MTGRICFPALYVAGGHGPEGKWPRMNVLGPLSRKLFRIVFDALMCHVAFRLSTLYSKDCTFHLKKRNYLLSH